jgi:hypothetical protein
MVDTVLDDALRKVHDAAKLGGAGSVQALNRAVAELVERPTPAYIAPLLLLLDDEADYDEAMFSLVHAAEAFDDADYAPKLLEALPAMRSKAPKWASIVLMRALNSSPTRDMLVRAARDATRPTKQAILWLCERINERSASFLDRTTAITVVAQSA